MQEDFLRLMKQLAPDLLDEMALRSLVLERIAALSPIGRRQLANRLNLPEREIRSAAASLKEQGLIQLDASGMTLTDKAAPVLPMAEAFSRAMRGLTDLEAGLASLLQVERVCVVAGDADTDPQVLRDVGRQAAARVRGSLLSGMTLAVTGGTTIQQTVLAMTSAAPLNIMVVPARGGMGRSVETQANTLAAELARRLGGHHRLLHLPDTLDGAARQEMLRQPEVAEVMALIQRADVILHGVGRADTTMKATRLSSATVKRLIQQGAVGEAFGAYYDREGGCLMESSSVGVDLARLSPSCRMMAVAAGASKAEAIIAVLRHRPHTLLVTDESAARRMLALLT